ncbi:MAG: tagaturonate reductase, partial [Bacteroidales bacterium]|nr:tagaturonate reductase [Bacteroidales bacterium]
HLKECIYKYIELWDLGEGFKNWFETACGVYCTLVDRIVPGYPRDTAAELCKRVGYEDTLLDKGEIFHLWVIEAPKEIAEEFPADKAGLNVLFVPSEAPYHERKVTLLNGPHTVLAPVAYLSGLNTVRESCEDELIGAFLHKVMFDELLPTLNLPEEELRKFASAVLERFVNPYVKHFVTSIMLNSFPKFKTRDLPGLKTYLERKGELPKGIVLGLAAICTYYKGGKRGKDEIVVNDDEAIKKLLSELWATGSPAGVAKGVLAAKFIWDEDLNEIPGLTAMLSADLELIGREGMRAAVKSIL